MGNFFIRTAFDSVSGMGYTKHAFRKHLFVLF